MIVPVHVLFTFFPGLLHSISLAKIPQLHSIILYDPSHPAVIPLLASIASPSVLKVKFLIAFEDTRKFRKKKAYDDLESLLLSSRYANLVDIYFVYKGSLDVAVVSRKVRDIFDVLSSRANVHVSAAEPSRVGPAVDNLHRTVYSSGRLLLIGQVCLSWTVSCSRYTTTVSFNRPGGQF